MEEGEGGEEQEEGRVIQTSTHVYSVPFFPARAPKEGCVWEGNILILSKAGLHLFACGVAAIQFSSSCLRGNDLYIIHSPPPSTLHTPPLTLDLICNLNWQCFS